MTRSMTCSSTIIRTSSASSCSSSVTGAEPRMSRRMPSSSCTGTAGFDRTEHQKSPSERCRRLRPLHDERAILGHRHPPRVRHGELRVGPQQVDEVGSGIEGATRRVDPAQEVDGLDADGSWIDQLADVEVLDRSAVAVGGTDSVSVDVTASAGAGEVPFIRPSAYGGDIVLRDSEVARVWIVDQGGSPPRPMVFFAPVLTSDTEWLSEADAVIESMVFGPVQEPPDL